VDVDVDVIRDVTDTGTGVRPTHDGRLTTRRRRPSRIRERERERERVREDKDTFTFTVSGTVTAQENRDRLRVRKTRDLPASSATRCLSQVFRSRFARLRIVTVT